MGTHDSLARMCAPRSPLAACLAAALALGAGAPASAAPRATDLLHRPADGLRPLLDKLARRAAVVHAVRHGTRRPEGGIVIPVTSCADDSTAGTLRHAVLTASSGDTVDMSALTCSTITLANGAINVDVDDLVIEGPGASHLTIDAGHTSRIFRHGGAGTLQVTALTVANGSYTPPTGVNGGGCIYSAATIAMTNAVATGCSASADGVIAGGALLAVGQIVLFGSAVTDSHVASINGYPSVAAAGGGAFAAQELIFEHSILSGNSVTTPLGTVYAGGAFGGNVIAKYSTVHGNTATTVTGGSYYSIGGGLASNGNVFIQNSTFDGNSADGAGGIDVRYSAGHTTTLINATISGNHANIIGGGMLAGDDITIENSTIAFNYASTNGGGGLLVEGNTAVLQSTIIADNSPSGMAGAADLDGGATVSGANNLIKISGIPVPVDTITTDPQLGVLAANGGETRTHALAETSPAIDMGNDTANKPVDQRGPGFPRVVGASADIGAYELNPDTIFADAFDAGG
jgi:hypothetical protein